MKKTLTLALLATSVVALATTPQTARATMVTTSFIATATAPYGIAPGYSILPAGQIFGEVSYDNQSPYSWGGITYFINPTVTSLSTNLQTVFNTALAKDPAVASAWLYSNSNPGEDQLTARIDIGNASFALFLNDFSGTPSPANHGWIAWFDAINDPDKTYTMAQIDFAEVSAITTGSVPEPSTLLLGASGLATLLGARVRRRAAPAA